MAGIVSVGFVIEPTAEITATVPSRSLASAVYGIGLRVAES
ncbi:hypothetical protein AB0C34_16480 [Nocardia sp. NPDC049220]